MNRIFRSWLPVVVLLLIAACTDPQPAPEGPLPIDVSGTDVAVTVIGAIHGQHRDSSSYSLPVLEAAITRFDPDYVLTEIPPAAMDAANAQWADSGKITQGRVTAFPGLTDVVFPLRQRLQFKIIPVSAWTRELADARSAELDRIQNDPALAEQWQEHLAARESFGETLGDRRDDPLFVHSEEYDAAVEAAQAPYQRHFNDRLGAGGWANINEAHMALVNDALDAIVAEAGGAPDKPVRVLILFGAWHKYWFLRELQKRDDIALVDAARLFE